MKFDFIAAEKDHFPVPILCQVMGVSRSGYYAWRGRVPSRRAVEDLALTDRIRVIHRRSRGTYGSPRVQAELRADGLRHGRRRIARLMRKASLAVRRRRRYRTTTSSRHTLPVAPNLLGRKFVAIAPNATWAADITYVPTGEGWLYLAIVLDLCTREVVGWAMASHMRAELVATALTMALLRCRPPRGLIHHSDRGSQYASAIFRRLLAHYGIAPSMSRKGDCYDNAPVESWFSTLKTELVEDRRFRSQAEARAAIFEYIEVFYNRQRRHSALGYATPVQFATMVRAA